MDKPTPETLHVQLTELNNRSRWYCSQLWQIPFAYVGICGITIGSILSSSNTLHPGSYLGVVSVVLAVIGMLITGHVFAIMKLQDMAIEKLQDVEKSLGIAVDGRAINIKWDVVFMTALITSTTLFMLAMGVYFISKG